YPGVIGLDAHDDALGVDLIDDAFAAAEHDRAGIARGDALHAGANQRRFALDQRHSLALHVRAHQRAVGVVVLEERNQAGGHGDELHVVDDAAALNLAVGRFDEAVIIDARETAQGADETDVRTFGGFNRADAAVVRRVHVADFEPRALPREAARPKCREAALVRD